MREIIHIQVGQCGNLISEQFWKFIAEEHAIDLTGKSYQNPAWEREIQRNVFFNERSSGKYSARSVLVDLEPAAISRVTGGSAGKLFYPSNSIYSNYGGSGTHFCKGHYTDGAELVDSVLDAVRREAELADTLQGFQFAHSLGGGTGSGLSTLTISKLREEYPDRMVFTFAVIPSPKCSDNVIEPYNAVLALHQLIENTEGAILLDNCALYNMCTTTFKLPKPTYEDLNDIIGIAMSNVTSSCRFPGQLNSDLRKTAMNLTPFPRLHFFTTSLSPMYPPDTLRSLAVPELLFDLFRSPNQLVSGDPKDGYFISGAVALRGQRCQTEVENILQNFQRRYPWTFLKWLPDQVKSSCCPVAPPGLPITASLLSNNTCIRTALQRIQSQFVTMFRRKAFLWGLTMEGMDEMEFQEAESNVHDIINEYDICHPNWVIEEELEVEVDDL